ncbi:UNVERIFIED_CONTAM: hypothetical protein HDU68_003790 [Siphonaria sp. JEL0065]|nr:hypothetical protein HDU68_003790 [Siphonaria sp. JEL0065]
MSSSATFNSLTQLINKSVGKFKNGTKSDKHVVLLDETQKNADSHALRQKEFITQAMRGSSKPTADKPPVLYMHLTMGGAGMAGTKLRLLSALHSNMSNIKYILSFTTSPL